MDNIKKVKQVDMLTTKAVSVLTQRFIEENGEELQVGSNHRIGYLNSEEGRKMLEENEPENIVNAVMAIWGDTPLVTKEVEQDIE